MKYRKAKESDRENVLRFCVDSFRWGDYIHQVWDTWYFDPTGRLFVAVPERKYGNQSRNIAIAVSHVTICPNKEHAWLEGIRVHQEHRRTKVATGLIKKMLAYAKRFGAEQASAAIANNNNASQLLFEKNGFKIISKWSYYVKKYKITYAKKESKARIAIQKDIDIIWEYIIKSPIYRQSGKRYFHSWRWYPLDYRRVVDFVKEQCIIITGNQVIDGVAIINNDFWKRISTLQIVYLDSQNISPLHDLVSFVINLYLISINKTHLLHEQNPLQILTFQTEHLSCTMKRLNFGEPEQFLLYSKKI